MTRSFTAVSLAAALTLGGAVVLVGPAASPASAVTNKVTVTTSKKVTAPYKKRATVRPTAKASGNVSIVSKTITVKKGGKTLVKRKASAKLKPGKYRTTTRVTYRTYSIKKTSTQVRVRVVAVEANEDVSVTCRLTSVTPREDLPGWDDVTASCTSPSFEGTINTAGYFVTYDDETDPNTVWSGSLDASFQTQSLTGAQLVVGTTFSDVATFHGTLYKTVNQTRTTSKRIYSAKKTKSVTRSLTVKAGKKPRGCATLAQYNKVKLGDISNNAIGGSTTTQVRSLLGSAGTRVYYNQASDGVETVTVEVREYKGCSKGAKMRVAFLNSRAYVKAYAG